MVKQNNKEKKSITLDQDVFEELVKRAERDDRSVSSMINKTLREAFQKEKEQK